MRQLVPKPQTYRLSILLQSCSNRYFTSLNLICKKKLNGWNLAYVHITHFWLYYVLILFSHLSVTTAWGVRGQVVYAPMRKQTYSDQVTYWTSLGSLVTLSSAHFIVSPRLSCSHSMELCVPAVNWMVGSIIEEAGNWVGWYSYIKSNHYSRKYFLSSYDRYSLACIIIIIPLNKLFKLGHACSWACEMQINTCFPKPLAPAISMHFPPPHIPPNAMAWNTSDHDQGKDSKCPFYTGQSIELRAFSKTTLFGLCSQKTSWYRIINLRRQLQRTSII